MNTDNPQSSTADRLPLLDDERVAVIEDGVFTTIESERAASVRRSVARGRVWMAGAAAAAVVAVAAIIAPTVLSGLSTNESGAAGLMPADMPVDGGMSGSEIALTDGAVVDGSGGGKAMDSAIGESGRSIIASSSATVVVDDVRAAADQIATAADGRGGYVESMSIGSGYTGMPVDLADPTVAVTNGWITVRIPADELADAMADLEQVGEVTASSIDRFDVTDQVVDLQARVDAAQASVDRLLELMGQAGSVSDLIAAESALAERQATLESYQQQLESLEDQVAMSSLNVSLTVRHEAVDANPAGFWDGLVAGWNGLVATLNGIVVALGFLIPWIAVVAVIGGAVWGIIVLVRRRRRPSAEE
ncbi:MULTISPECIES: DUF4349 domain-containing protein [unclassified Microbacterium]|jgi:hypothetical protein|uniref:DUF4349 domain-containing protein n=1 Tax=unclassified Microbacterium TaxID=2609290 RepID=UPI000966359D|nr:MULTISPECIES: DUF4349 domain-containing protein [unclassified Microbacterium]OJV94131.1 MAG: hypothetical protein BGO47_08480 [Microbacterium sp. 67-17]